MVVFKYKLSEIKTKLSDQYDLFICSSSYEKRCLSVVKHIVTDRFKKTLIISNKEYDEFTNQNTKEIEGYLKGKLCHVKTSTDDPLITTDGLHAILSETFAKCDIKSVLLDITTFTHESLLILLRLLKLQTLRNLTLIYANASEYSVNDNVDRKWLSNGVKEIRSVIGYPGKIMPFKKTHLILLVGYEHERAATLIEALEPNSISLGYGESGSATTDKNKEANEHYMHLVKNMAVSYNTINEFVIPCDNPYEAKNKIEHQVSINDEKNIVLAPMNNKLTTVGAALACFQNDDIQICYAQALQHNHINYSSPGEHCYCLPMQDYL